jgi:hypothetical protein
MLFEIIYEASTAINLGNIWCCMYYLVNDLNIAKKIEISSSL